MSAATKRICFFGSYKQSYRNQSLIQGLRAHGYTVIECRDTTHNVYLRLYRLFTKLASLHGRYEYILIGFPNHQLVPLVRLWTRKPILFDIFISLYNTGIEDRKLFAPRSLKAIKARCIDYLALKAADTVLIDTNAHAQYLAKSYAIAYKKFCRVPIGSDQEIFSHVPKAQDDQLTFHVKFYGSYSPLQGVQYIIRAANLLQAYEDIHFTLLGAGQTLSEMQELVDTLKLQNVTFMAERVPIEEVVAFLQDASVCLGIFGDTNKANFVVPHKVYDALALGKPVISARTDAIQEFFADKNDILLCNRADGTDLAEKILLLKKDEVMRERIAVGGYELSKNQFTPQQLIKPLVSILQKYSEINNN